MYIGGSHLANLLRATGFQNYVIIISIYGGASDPTSWAQLRSWEEAFTAMARGAGDVFYPEQQGGAGDVFYNNQRGCWGPILEWTARGSKNTPRLKNRRDMRTSNYCQCQCAVWTCLIKEGGVLGSYPTHCRISILHCPTLGRRIPWINHHIL